MMRNVAEKMVLITGASTGIGAATAWWLAGKGLRVFAGVRRPEDGERVAAKQPDAIFPVLLDVTDEDSIQEAFAQVEKRTDRLHGLVNNAGIAVGAPLEFVPLELFRKQFEVNVFGLLRVTQVFLPLLRRAQGRIVNIGSISGRLTTPLLGPYCASKHAVEALSDALRLELRRWGLQVSLIEPGAVATPIWEKGRKGAERMRSVLPPEAFRLYEKDREAIARAVVQVARRAVRPEEVAKKVEHALLAARPRTRYLTGRDARPQAILAKWLPDRWRDAVILRLMGR